MQICIHRKDNLPKPVNHRLTGGWGVGGGGWGGGWTNPTTSEDSQAMISYKLVSDCKALGPIISEL